MVTPAVGLGYLLRAHGVIIVGYAEENHSLDHVSIQPVDPLWRLNRTEETRSPGGQSEAMLQYFNLSINNLACALIPSHKWLKYVFPIFTLTRLL